MRGRLEDAGIRSDTFRGRLPMLKVARPNEHGEAVRREILCDLKADSFVSPDDQGDGFVPHSNLLFAFEVRVPQDGDPAHARRILGPDPGHFAKTIIREILRLPFFDRLQNEAGDEFGLVAVGVIRRRSATGRISHPVLAKISRRDERVNFTDDDAVSFQLCARRQAQSKERTLRRRVNTVLRDSHERSPRIDVYDAAATLRTHQRNHSLHRDNRPQHVEVEDFVKQGRIDFLYGGRIAAPRIVDEAVERP